MSVNGGQIAGGLLLALAALWLILQTVAGGLAGRLMNLGSSSSSGSSSSGTSPLPGVIPNITTPPAGASPSQQASTATSSFIGSLFTPFGEAKFGAAVAKAFANQVSPATVQSGGAAPADPYGTETIGGKTYKPVPGSSSTGYVWQEVSS